jgi:hypothetical protein
MKRTCTVIAVLALTGSAFGEVSHYMREMGMLYRSTLNEKFDSSEPSSYNHVLDDMETSMGMHAETPDDRAALRTLSNYGMVRTLSHLCDMGSRMNNPCGAKRKDFLFKYMVSCRQQTDFFIEEGKVSGSCGDGTYDKELHALELAEHPPAAKAPSAPVTGRTDTKCPLEAPKGYHCNGSVAVQDKP